jgi:sulfate transport system ATP-binding protein
MTAAQNIGFGIRSKPWRARPTEREIRAKVSELLQLVQLETLGDRFPSQLSGGQRQRVALARALAIEPSILLLDEPFGALDAKVRRELRIWLRDIHERTGLTTIFVTHDQEEALELADRVAVLRDGALEQVGTPEALYHEPANGFVFDFLGDTIHLPCTIEGDVAIIAGARVPIIGPHPNAGSATAYARPHALTITAGEVQGLLARVRDVSLAGPDARIECALDQGGLLEVRIDHDAASQFKPRDRVSLLPRNVRILS